MKKKLNIHLLIIIFALLHGLVFLLCTKAGIDRTYFLTILSLAMTAMICIREKFSLNITAICIILTNIFGIVLSKEIGSILNFIGMTAPWRGMVSTMLTTFAIGWGFVLFAAKMPGDGTRQDNLKERHIVYMTAAALAILLARIFFESYLMHYFFRDRSLRDTLAAFLSHPILLVVMACITVSFIRRRKTGRLARGIVRHIELLLICGPGMAAVLILLFSKGNPGESTIVNFMEMTIVAVIVEIAVYSLAFLINYLFEARETAMEEKIKANQAKAQYISLKRQVSPHFLFNNLNILDCMVAENSNADARRFISHLTGLYRHMLKYENEPVITLKEEMSYVTNYMKLLNVRFPKGVEVIYEIREEDLLRYVVTYSVQLLVENAVKHNATPHNNPLVIRIFSDGSQICISNNLIPRLSPLESTGHGLEYVRQSYLDCCGKDIHIEKSGGNYSVSIPLL